MSTKHRKCIQAACLGLVFAGLFSGAAWAQESGPMPAPRTNGASVDEYKIGPGDVLAVTIVDAPELSARYRVSDSGFLQLPLLAKPIDADGQTPEQLAHTIHTALVDAKQLRDPKVNVFVEQFRGRTITVLGSVAKPSVYPLDRRTNVLEALSMAGGLLPNAGNVVTVIRGRASAEATNTPVGSVQILDLSKIVKGQDPGESFEVRSGDTISVSTAAIVYVVGAVTKPGGYPMPDQSSGISVVQAVALAEGYTSIANLHHGLIVRQSSNDVARQEIPVDIAQFMTGKRTDVSLAPNDILYIPNSKAKETLKAMGDIAEASIIGISTYGIGYRIGETH
jgi:polysaccharide biosynthesis/export protein